MHSFYNLFFLILLISCGAGGGGGALQSPSFPEKSNSESSSVVVEKSVFLSYDDTGSTAISQLLKYQINFDETVDSELASPHELLNAEKFDESIGFDELGDFNISLGILKSESKEPDKVLYDLGVHIKGPQLTFESRPNLVLTYLVDVSGSMGGNTGAGALSSRSKMKLVKDGMISSLSLLKEGDVVSIVVFSTIADVVYENYIHGVSNEDSLVSAIEGISAKGTTNLEKGLTLAYSTAKKYFESEKKNRVVLLTDAYINSGETSATEIVKNRTIDNEEGILLSGVGIGFDFNASFLEELTDAGSGNQFLAATDEDVENVFSGDFLSLLMVAAQDFKVEIRYPERLEHIASASEETSLKEEDLKGVNFAYNTSQYFLERFKTDMNSLIGSDAFTIALTYKDPLTNEKKSFEKQYVLSDLLDREDGNIKDALSIIFLTNLVRGSKDWDDITWQFDHVLKGHSSDLYLEFKKLMYKFYGVDFDDTF